MVLMMMMSMMVMSSGPNCFSLFNPPFTTAFVFLYREKICQFRETSTTRDRKQPGTFRKKNQTKMADVPRKGKDKPNENKCNGCICCKIHALEASVHKNILTFSFS